MTETPVLFTLGEAAQRLGVSYEWLRREAQAARVPHVRIARQYRFTAAQLAEITQAHVMQAVDADPEPSPKPKSASGRRRGKTQRGYPTFEAHDGK